MEPSEAKRKRFSGLSEEEIQNLIEGKDYDNTRKATKARSTRIRIFWNPQLFLSVYGYHPHVSGELDNESGKK